MKIGSIKYLAPAALLLAATIPASAGTIPLNGDFAISFNGTITYSPGDPSPLKDAAIISLSGVTLFASGQLDTYLGNPNDFCTNLDPTCTHTGPAPIRTEFLSNTIVTFASNWVSHPGEIDLTGLNLPTFTFNTTTPDTLTFTATGIVVQRTTNGGATGVNVYFAGLLNDSGSAYDPNMPASVSLTFTQTGGASGGVSGAGTLATPPETPPGTPEPASMVLLGSALVGLGAFGRKKLAR